MWIWIQNEEKGIAVDLDVYLNPRQMKQKNWTHIDLLKAISSSVLRLKNKTRLKNGKKIKKSEKFSYLFRLRGAEIDSDMVKSVETQTLNFNRKLGSGDNFDLCKKCSSRTLEDETSENICPSVCQPKCPSEPRNQIQIVANAAKPLPIKKKPLPKKPLSKKPLPKVAVAESSRRQKEPLPKVAVFFQKSVAQKTVAKRCDIAKRARPSTPKRASPAHPRKATEIFENTTPSDNWDLPPTNPNQAKKIAKMTAESTNQWPKNHSNQRAIINMKARPNPPTQVGRRI